MSENPHLRPLKGFDPARLVIDESFIPAKPDAAEKPALHKTTAVEPPSDVERVHHQFRTAGAVHSSCIRLENGFNRAIFAVANLKGEIYFFEQTRGSLRVVSKISLQGAFYSAPVFRSGVIYCAAKDGTLYSVDTGLASPAAEVDGIRNSILWHRRMKKGILAEPVIHEGMLFVTAFDGVYAFDISDPRRRGADAPVWGVSINGTVSTPAVGPSMFFVGSEDMRLFGFNHAEGKPRRVWEYELKGSCRMKPCIVPDGETVVAATVNGYICALNCGSGVYRWGFNAGSPVIGNIASGTLNGDEHFYFGTDSGDLICLNNSGRVVWRFNAGASIRTEPVIHDGRVIFGSEKGILFIIDAFSGKEIFRFNAGGGIFGSPAVHEGRVIFGSTDGFIHSINF